MSQLTERELLELDAWIATNVMNWHRQTNAQSMGIVDFKGFTETEIKHIRSLDDCWYDAENKFAAHVDGECDCGQSSDGFHPHTDPATAMEVLKKCTIESPDEKVEVLRAGEEWLIQCKDGAIYLTAQSETLELAICLFAKKLFSK